jgi:CRP-like cAMP-binding protein
MVLPESAAFRTMTTTPILAGTDFEAQKLVGAEGTLREYAPGERIVCEGDEGHAFYILLAGDVEVVKRANSPLAVRLTTLAAGEFFGEMCILGPMPRAASVRAINHCMALEIRAATLHHLYQQMPAQYAIVLLNIARDMARRLYRIDEEYVARAA